MYTGKYIYIYVCMHIYIHIYIYTYINRCVYICIHMYICTLLTCFVQICVDRLYVVHSLTLICVPRFLHSCECLIHMCRRPYPTHLLSVTCVTWLVHTCKWLIHMCRSSISGETLPYISPSVMCVTWLVYIFDMTRLHFRHDSFICVVQVFLERLSPTYSPFQWYVWHDSLIFVTWLIYMFRLGISGETLPYISPSSDMCAMTRLYLRHDSFICIV